jgi:FixJ family two-component response regulator
MTVRPLVSVVDDDESVRESLPDLIKEFGFAVEAFASAEAFLASDATARSQCLVVDIAMPGMSGFDLQNELVRQNIRIPIVFITARQDAVVRRRARELGAVDCLNKPFSEAALLEALNAALE